VTINGVAQDNTSGGYYVPAGQAMVVTYATAPTMNRWAPTVYQPVFNLTGNLLGEVRIEDVNFFGVVRVTRALLDQGQGGLQFTRGSQPEADPLRDAEDVMRLRLASGELTEVVRRISLLAQKNAPLRLAFKPGELTISAQSQDVGETSESLPLAYTGEPLEIGFNAEFLADGVDSVTGDTVRLKLINPLRPGLITADGDAFWYLIMPIRLAG
jgi:hypothetical protein